MDQADPGPGAHDDDGFPASARDALADLRAALRSDDNDAYREVHLNRLLHAFAAAVGSEGIAPGAALVALRAEWDRAATFPVLMYSRLSQDERRLLAIDAFVVAYFATPTDRLSDQEWSGSDPRHEEGESGD